MKKTFQLKLGIFSQLQSATMQYVRNQIQSTLCLQTPLLSGPFTKYPGGGAYLFQAHLRESLFERWGLLHLETTTVSALHKELEYKVEKLTHKKF